MKELRGGNCPQCKVSGCFFWLGPPEGILHWYCPNCREEGISGTYEQKRAIANARSERTLEPAPVLVKTQEGSALSEDHVEKKNPQGLAGERQSDPSEKQMPAPRQPARASGGKQEHHQSTPAPNDRIASGNGSSLAPTPMGLESEKREESEIPRYGPHAQSSQTEMRMTPEDAKPSKYGPPQEETNSVRAEGTSPENTHGPPRRVCPECQSKDPMFWVDAEGALCWFCPQCEKKGVAYKVMK